MADGAPLSPFTVERRPHIEWQHPSNSWALDHAYLLAFLFESVLLILFCTFGNERRHQFETFTLWGYILRNGFILGFLIYAPISNFLARYSCEAPGTQPDLSGVSDIFGQGAYLGWLCIGIGTLLHNELGDQGGRFFFPHLARYRGDWLVRRGQDVEDRGSGVGMTGRIFKRVEDLGIDGSTFFVTSCVAIAYYGVQVTTGRSGPVVEAAEPVLSFTLVFSAALCLNATGLPGFPYQQKQTRVIGWGILFLISVGVLSWKNSELWEFPFLIFQVVMLGGLLILMFLTARNVLTTDAVFEVHTRAEEFFLVSDQAVLPNCLMFAMVLTVNWMGVGILVHQQERIINSYSELSEEAQRACRYDYRFLPQSIHYLKDWGQALTFSLAIIGLAAQFLPRLEEGLISIGLRFWELVRKSGQLPLQGRDVELRPVTLLSREDGEILMDDVD